VSRWVFVDGCFRLSPTAMATAMIPSRGDPHSKHLLRTFPHSKHLLRTFRHSKHLLRTFRRSPFRVANASSS
jgi:hypothetical protein